ncbi:MAG TPA: DUF892 family protein [Chloroflexota bacterium]|nr:DUF892 family protein [Chloroflexota bacterium]
MPHTELLARWLQQAYGMKAAVIDTLDTQLPRLTDEDPDLQEKLLAHLEQTHRHGNLIQGCIARLGGTTSSMERGGLTTFIEEVNGSWSSPPGGRPARYLVTDFAVEHYEMAACWQLIAGAGVFGDAETVRASQEVLLEDREMADWLREHLPDAARRVVQSSNEAQAERNAGQRPGDAALPVLLNDAYALEKALARLLREQARAARDYGELREVLEDHRRQTQHHARQIEGCIKRHALRPSGGRSILDALCGTAGELLAGGGGEKVLRNTVNAYAAEKYEVALYTVLIAAAQSEGDAETASTCETILHDEEQMARRLEEQVPRIAESLMGAAMVEHQ